MSNMIIVTGGAGFIGSNIIRQLNALGYENILVVDNLQRGGKFRNLVDLKILDYMDKHVFIERIKRDDKFAEKTEVIFHQGACTDTTEWDGNYMMQNNYEYTKLLFHYCLSDHIPFIYASSAAIYGLNKTAIEDPQYEEPLNVYGYSKLLFDQYVRKFFPEPKSLVVGLRYFNVYGPRESHKGNMASVMYHFNNQIIKDGVVKLFGAYDDYEAGEQKRDFVYVEDIARVNIWFWQQQRINLNGLSGIYNIGTGKRESFNAAANMKLLLGISAAKLNTYLFRINCGIAIRVLLRRR